MVIIDMMRRRSRGRPRKKLNVTDHCTMTAADKLLTSSEKSGSEDDSEMYIPKRGNKKQDRSSKKKRLSDYVRKARRKRGDQSKLNPTALIEGLSGSTIDLSALNGTSSSSSDMSVDYVPVRKKKSKKFLTGNPSTYLKRVKHSFVAERVNSPLPVENLVTDSSQSTLKPHDLSTQSESVERVQRRKSFSAGQSSDEQGQICSQPIEESNHRHNFTPPNTYSQCSFKTGGTKKFTNDIRSSKVVGNRSERSHAGKDQKLSGENIGSSNVVGNRSERSHTSKDQRLSVEEIESSRTVGRRSERSHAGKDQKLSGENIGSSNVVGNRSERSHRSKDQRMSGEEIESSRTVGRRSERSHASKDQKLSVEEIESSRTVGRRSERSHAGKDQKLSGENIGSSNVVGNRSEPSHTSKDQRLSVEEIESSRTVGRRNERSHAGKDQKLSGENIGSSKTFAKRSERGQTGKDQTISDEHARASKKVEKLIQRTYGNEYKLSGEALRSCSKVAQKSNRSDTSDDEAFIVNRRDSRTFQKNKNSMRKLIDESAESSGNELEVNSGIRKGTKERSTIRQQDASSNDEHFLKRDPMRKYCQISSTEKKVAKSGGGGGGGKKPIDEVVDESKGRTCRIPIRKYLQSTMIENVSPSRFNRRFSPSLSPINAAHNTTFFELVGAVAVHDSSVDEVENETDYGTSSKYAKEKIECYKLNPGRSLNLRNESSNDRTIFISNAKQALRLSAKHGSTISVNSNDIIKLRSQESLTFTNESDATVSIFEMRV